MPGRANLWNLERWARRLGFKREDVPDIPYAVQPVQIVGDASALTSPLHPPMAWFGDLHVALVLHRNTLTVQSIAPGGLYVRTVRATDALGGVSNFVWTIGPPPPSVGFIPLTAVDFGPDPVASIVRVGDDPTPGLGVVDIPQSNQGAGIMFVLTDEVFVPAGQFFTVQHSLEGSLVAWGCMIQEVPVASGGE